MSLKDKYCIVGAATTKFGRVPGVSPLQFTVEAAKLAIEDAGLEKERRRRRPLQVPPDRLQGPLGTHKVSQALGIQPVIAATIDQAGATNLGLVQYAMMAIDAGLITTAVCCYGDNPLSGNPGTYGRPVGTDAAYGMIGAPGGYAMIAQRHMTEFGTTSEQLGAVAVSTRGWASKNPNAHKRDPLTLEDHQASRYVTWPLHLLDCCLVSDGGAAL